MKFQYIILILYIYSFLYVYSKTLSTLFRKNKRNKGKEKGEGESKSTSLDFENVDYLKILRNQGDTSTPPQPIKLPDPLRPEEIKKDEYIVYMDRNYVNEGRHMRDITNEYFCFNSGCYKVISEIAGGTQGTIYRAENYRRESFTIKFSFLKKSMLAILRSHETLSRNFRFLKTKHQTKQSNYRSRIFDALMFDTRDDEGRAIINLAILGDLIPVQNLQDFVHTPGTKKSEISWLIIITNIIESTYRFHLDLRFLSYGY